MIITVTSIRLKSLWGFFELSLHGLRITRQLRQQNGFIRMKNTGLGYLHYTLNFWESEEAMKQFSHSGAHLKAMGKSRKLAQEIRVYTYLSDHPPSWKEAKKLLLSHGRILSFNGSNKTNHGV
jgi:hypothetical protein